MIPISLTHYTKDAMKDLLFIGRGTNNAPGRRKIKYRSDVKAWKEERKVSHFILSVDIFTLDFLNHVDQ